MNDKSAGAFFDDIIKTLTIEAETAKFANIPPDTLCEFLEPPAGAQIDTVPKRSAAPSTLSEAAPLTTNRTPPQRQRQPPPPQPQPTQQPPQLRAEVIPPATLAAMDINALLAAARGCRGCPLHANRRNLVFGAGSPDADLMFIGEGPGREEDRQGVPFVGEAGQLLTKMINAMCFSRSEVYIANIVKCRPPNNRAPDDDEADACLPFLRRQIELVRPKVIVLLGAVALKYLMGVGGITRARGKWLNYNGIKAMPTFHPAYLLRNPQAKKDVWEDLQKVMALFGKTRSPISGR